MACFVYTIFGSCKDPALGPTAIMAIMTRENIHDMGPEFAILLCFITGIVQLIMGFAQLGNFAFTVKHYISLIIRDFILTRFVKHQTG